MSDSTRTNAISGLDQPQLTRTLRRHELVDHLNNFHRDVNRYIHAMPGVIMGVPCTDVIQAAMSLNWYIAQLKANLIEVMFQEGLSPVRDDEAISGPMRFPSIACTSTPIRNYSSQYPRTRNQNNNPQSMGDYLEGIIVAEQNNSDSVSQLTSSLSGISPVNQRSTGSDASTVPSRPSRSIDSSTAYMSARSPGSSTFVTAQSHLTTSGSQGSNSPQRSQQQMSGMFGQTYVIDPGNNERHLPSGNSDSQYPSNPSPRSRHLSTTNSASQFSNSIIDASNIRQTDTPGNSSSLARPFM